MSPVGSPWQWWTALSPSSRPSLSWTWAADRGLYGRAIGTPLGWCGLRVSEVFPVLPYFKDGVIVEQAVGRGVDRFLSQ